MPALTPLPDSSGSMSAKEIPKWRSPQHQNTV